MKWAKPSGKSWLKGAAVIAFSALGVYEYTHKISNDGLAASLQAAMVVAVPVAQSSEPLVQHSGAAPVNQPLPFKVAPDANDMFDAAKLFANALNPELEKKWLGIRLHTRLSREYEAQSTANLNVKKNTLKTLELTAKIDAFNRGEVPGDTPGSDPAALANQAALFDELAQQWVSVVSYTPATADAQAFVSLRLGDKTVDRVRQHHYVGAFEVMDLRDEKRCVVLKYKSHLVQNRCL
jgi:hypothetical protein